MTSKQLLETLACCLIGIAFALLLWHMAVNW